MPLLLVSPVHLAPKLLLRNERCEQVKSVVSFAKGPYPCLCRQAGLSLSLRRATRALVLTKLPQGKRTPVLMVCRAMEFPDGEIGADCYPLHKRTGFNPSRRVMLQEIRSKIGHSVHRSFAIHRDPSVIRGVHFFGMTGWGKLYSIKQANGFQPFAVVGGGIILGNEITNRSFGPLIIRKSGSSFPQLNKTKSAPVPCLHNNAGL